MSHAAILPILAYALALFIVLYALRHKIVRRVETAAGAFAERFMSWRNEALFRLRIAIRVSWLRATLLARRRNRGIGLHHLFRPLAVLLTFAAILYVLQKLGVPVSDTQSRMSDLLTSDQNAEKLKWQDALILVGAPIAFALWAFRDFHEFQTLENQRKDVNLKEFQEIQMRAAGALDEKLPAEAREQLQIAALHQLRVFLRGEYGQAFRRPACELLLAGHRTAMERAGLLEWLQQWREANSDPPGDLFNLIELSLVKMTIQARRSQWTPLDRDRAGVLRDEWSSIFRSPIPLNGRRFDGIEFPSGVWLSSLRFVGSVFTGADMEGAHLEGADLTDVHLECAGLRWAHLEGADLRRAHLEHADLVGAHLERANLWRAHLEGADLIEGHLERANLSWAYLEGVNLSWAHFEGADLRKAELESANLFRAHLEGADLGDANLKCANLRGAHLERASLRGTHLEGADLREAHLEGADLTGARLDGAKLGEN